MPLTEYVKYHVLTRLTPSFPQVIQVQTQYGCNARCTFCPMGREQNQIRGRMDDVTYARVVDQAVEGGAKVLSPYLQNDPLVDREIDQRVAYVVERRGARVFPKTKLITNGALLTADRGHALIRRWLEALQVQTLFIEPGNPWENGYVESFNGKLRDELLDREIFYTLTEAQILIERWRRQYNTVRPHSALGYRPPAPEAVMPTPIGGLIMSPALS